MCVCKCFLLVSGDDDDDDDIVIEFIKYSNNNDTQMYNNKTIRAMSFGWKERKEKNFK